MRALSMSIMRKKRKDKKKREEMSSSSVNHESRRSKQCKLSKAEGKECKKKSTKDCNTLILLL